MARVIPPSNRPAGRQRTARTNKERSEQPDRDLPDISLPDWMPDQNPDSDDTPENGPQQAGLFSSGRLPLLIGGIGLLAGSLVFLTNRS